MTALTWQRDNKCFACHSNYAYLETRPLVSWKTPVHDELRTKLEELAANPRQVRFRVMEGVMAACVLAQNDALTTGKLHPVTRQALDTMWTLQRDDGGFDWEKSQQPPSEIDDHFGATMAVIGVGVAPDGYAATPAAQAGLDKIRQYLMNTPPVNLHQRSMLLLGSLHVDGILTEAERKDVVDDLFAVQKQDGGWGLVSLGNWKRHDGKPDDHAIQRRLRNRLHNLRAAPGRSAGRRSEDPSRHRLVEGQPTGQRPLVHSEPVERQPALPEPTGNGIRDPSAGGVRRTIATPRVVEDVELH